jgi:hypothetical protein
MARQIKVPLSLFCFAVLGAHNILSGAYGIHRSEQQAYRPGEGWQQCSAGIGWWLLLNNYFPACFLFPCRQCLLQSITVWTFTALDKFRWEELPVCSIMTLTIVSSPSHLIILTASMRVVALREADCF